MFVWFVSVDASHQTSFHYTSSHNAIFAISYELLLFSPWLVAEMHTVGKTVLVYFLAFETPKA